jgi:hypothetical protein
MTVNNSDSDKDNMKRCDDVSRLQLYLWYTEILFMIILHLYWYSYWYSYSYLYSYW